MQAARYRMQVRARVRDIPAMLGPSSPDEA